jgi:hypothetical protein
VVGRRLDVSIQEVNGSAKLEEWCQGCRSVKVEKWCVEGCVVVGGVLVLRFAWVPIYWVKEDNLRGIYKFFFDSCQAGVII